MRVRGQVPRLTRLLAGREVDDAVQPEGPYGSGMRAAVRSGCRYPVVAGAGEDVLDAAPWEALAGGCRRALETVTGAGHAGRPGRAVGHWPCSSSHSRGNMSPVYDDRSDSKLSVAVARRSSRGRYSTPGPGLLSPAGPIQIVCIL